MTWRRGILLAAWAILLGVVFAPLIALVGSALTTPAAVGFDATPNVLGARVLVLLARSLLLAGCAGCAATVLGLIAGYAVSLQPRARAYGMLALMLTPLAMPPFVHALAWIMLCSHLGLSCHGFWPTVLVLGASFCPLSAFLCWAGIERVGGDLTDAAMLGRGRLHAFTRVELGLIRPHVCSALLLTSLFALSDYGVPSLLRVNTYPVLVFAQFAAHYSVRGAVAGSWPYALIPAVAALLWYTRTGHGLYGALGKARCGQGRSVTSRERGGWAAAFAAIVLVAGVLPMLSLLATAGGTSTYVRAWRTAGGQALTSMGLAAAAATGILLMAGCVTAAARLNPGRARALLDYGSLLPLALPGTLCGIGCILLWNRPGTQFVYGTMGVVLLLHAARFLPFAVLILTAGARQVDADLVAAASLSEAPGLVIFRRVVAPLMASSSLVAWVVCFGLSLRELAGTLLVTPPGVETLAVRIYSLYHYGVGELVAAMCLFLVGFNLLAAAGAVLAIRGVRKC